MKILVCITNVPDTISKIAFKEGNSELIKDGITFVIGTYDDYALARAVEIKEALGGSVTALNVGLDTEPTLRKALAIGADDAVRINVEPTDGYFVAKQIANYAQDKGFDLILMGRESSDFNGGQVHGMVGELLGIPSLSPIMKLDLEGTTAKLAREIEGGKEYLEASLPLVLGCQEPIAEWKIPNMRGIMSARAKPLVVIEPSDDALLTIGGTYQLPPARSGCKFIPAEQAELLIELLKNEAKVL